MTSDEALLLLGESVADAIAGAFRSLAAEDVSHGTVMLAPKGELALQGLPPVGVVSSARYENTATGGNVVVMSRRAARKLAMLARGENPEGAGDGSIPTAQLSVVSEAASRLLADAVATMGALLGEDLAIAPPVTRVYESTAEALKGIDIGSRATSVTIAAAGESYRFVQLIPNALLIRMTQVFDDRVATRSYTANAGAVPPDTVREVTLTLRAELGRTRLTVRQASGLASGAAVTLDRRIDDPVELFVNGQHFGTGELVAQGGRFAVRITEVTGVRPHGH